MAERAKKAVRTKKQMKTASRVAEHRKRLMQATKGLLLEWEESTLGKLVCVVCGDGIPPTILQRHHVDPFNKSERKVLLCASCHNIYNKAKEETGADDVIRGLNLRRKQFDRNFNRSAK